MKILIADDDQVSRMALKDIVGCPHGWEITEVDDGEMAMEKLCDGLKPDLCIFDIKMPRLDGLQLLQRIRRDPLLKSLKVLMTSSTRDRDTIIALSKLQISGYLLKPYDTTKARAILEPLFPSLANPALASRNLLTKTILVADDDPVVQEALKSFIAEKPNWEAVIVGSGREALERLHAGLRPDLVVTDLRMPGIDGIGLLQRMRADPELEKLRVAIVSGDQDRDQFRVLAQLKIFGYLLKPCSSAKFKELLAKVETDRAA